MRFIALSPLERSGLPERIVNLEHPRGANMRIRPTGRQSLEVVKAVSKVLFSVGS